MIRLDALPELVDAITGLQDAASSYGIRFTTADEGGFRTEADTAKILGYRDAEYAIYSAKERAAGRTPMDINKWRPISPYGRSYHNFGAARDLKITSTPAGMSTSDALATLGNLAPTFGLKWGGTFGDPVHFELAASLADVAAAWTNYTNGGTDTPPESPAIEQGGALGLVAAVTVGLWLLRRRRRQKGAQ